VNRLGGSEASTAVAEAYRAFQAAHLKFARDGGPLALAQMLAALTTLEMAASRSGRAKEAAGVRFAPPAAPFLAVLRDLGEPGRGEPEFRVAAGVASCATWPAESEGPSRNHAPPAAAGRPGWASGQPRWRDARLFPASARARWPMSWPACWSGGPHRHRRP